MSNPYLAQVQRALPRLLALYDSDPTSATRGLGDRYRWAWKLIDFANATFQGAVNGLARLVVAEMLPAGVAPAAILRRIDAMVRACAVARDTDGSFAEAFPGESSFCVTALVAYDVLTAIEVLGPRLDTATRAAWLDAIRPAIAFLHRADEGHAAIANHIATAAAALYKWHWLAGEGGEARGRTLLDRVLAWQSPEGWFREYEGADPGYETLGLGYLADLHRLRPDLGLGRPLARSLAFLAYCAHPDGSFGGLYGSRNTRFCLPAGIEAMAGEAPEAAALAAFLRRSVAARRVVTLDAVDAPNLVPVFNAYAWAATLAREPIPDAPPLPFARGGAWRQTLPDAGLVIDKGRHHYTIVSVHKGGVLYHFADGKARIDAGVAVRDRRGRVFTTQAHERDNPWRLAGDHLEVTAPLTARTQRLPRPLEFAALRLLGATAMRSPALREAVKRRLVRMLITGRRRAPLANRRTIVLGPEAAVSDAWVGAGGGFTRIAANEPFSAIHMASAGYWQAGDDDA